MSSGNAILKRSCMRRLTEYIPMYHNKYHDRVSSGVFKYLSVPNAYHSLTLSHIHTHISSDRDLIGRSNRSCGQHSEPTLRQKIERGRFTFLTMIIFLSTIIYILWTWIQHERHCFVVTHLVIIYLILLKRDGKKRPNDHHLLVGLIKY